MLGWLNASLKSTETRDELSTTLYPQSKINFLLIKSITFGLQVCSSSLVSILFREAFNHPYISFFHLLVNVFFVMIIKFNFKIFFSNISSNEIPPRSACKCLQHLYQSVAIHLKYVLLVLLLLLLKYLGLQPCPAIGDPLPNLDFVPKQLQAHVRIQVFSIILS